jgi:hypothetical protein
MNKEITAGSAGSRTAFNIWDYDETLLAVSGISALAYEIDNLTEEVEVRASTAINPIVNSGYIQLEATDTAMQGTGSRETCRLCLLVNGEIWEGNTFYFDIVPRSCS